MAALAAGKPKVKNVLRCIALVWLTATPSVPVDEEGLRRWAAQRGLHPESVPQEMATRHDPSVVRRIERLLGEARQAGTAVGRGAGVFSEIDHLLTMHAELPQAGWLWGERLALEARFLAQRSADASSAARRKLSSEARSVSGARASALGEARLPPTNGPPSSLTVRLRVDDHLLIDGEPHAPTTLLSPGRHHLQIFRAGRRLRAQWIDLLEGKPEQVADTSVPCSAQDLLGATPGGERPSVPDGVLCQEWIAAQGGIDGSTLVSHCRRSYCEPWASTRPAPMRLQSAGAVPPTTEPATVPVWLTWTAVGVGAVLTTGLVLWQAGSFDRSPPSTEFTFTGPRAAGVRF